MLFVRHGKFVVISLIDYEEKGPFVRCDVGNDGEKIFQLDCGAEKIQGDDPVPAKVKAEPKYPELYFKATIKDDVITDVVLSHYWTMAAFVVPSSDKQRQPALSANGVDSHIVDGIRNSEMQYAKLLDERFFGEEGKLILKDFAEIRVSGEIAPYPLLPGQNLFTDGDVVIFYAKP